jgi:hypothetical protein
MMRYWLSRLALSFIVVGLVLCWEVYKGSQDGTLRGARLGLYVAGIVVCLSGGLAGMKERHRKDDRL